MRRGRGRWRVSVLVKGAVALSVITIVAANVIGGGGGGTTANLWVNTTAGGTPARCSTACTYSATSAYGSFDAAWDAASAGDLIRVKAGTYTAQTITGDKASDTAILAETGTTIGSLSAQAAHMDLENFTVTGTNVGVDGNNITLVDMKLHNLEPDVVIDGTNDTWRGGEFGFAGWDPTDRSFCGASAIPIQLIGAVNPTLDGINLYGNDIDPGAGASCQHMEYIRIDQGGSGATLRNLWFEPGDNSDTASILITATSNNATYDGFTAANNFFGAPEFAGQNAVSLQGHENVDTCTNWHWLYNTYVAYPYALSSASGGGCSASQAGWVWVGNIGPYATSSPCTGTHILNRWQHNVSGTCGTDTWTTGSAFNVDQLGFDTTTGQLQAGSVAINAAETNGASDYCTATAGASGLGSIDHEGTVRPQGAACDDGWDER